MGSEITNLAVNIITANTVALHITYIANLQTDIFKQIVFYCLVDKLKRTQQTAIAALEPDVIIRNELHVVVIMQLCVGNATFQGEHNSIKLHIRRKKRVRHDIKKVICVTDHDH